MWKWSRHYVCQWIWHYKNIRIGFRFALHFLSWNCRPFAKFIEEKWTFLLEIQRKNGICRIGSTKNLCSNHLLGHIRKTTIFKKKKKFFLIHETFSKNMKERIVHSHARIFLLCLADIAADMHTAERGTFACVSVRVSVLHKIEESVHGFLIHSAHHARWRRPAYPTSLEHNNIDMTPLYYCLRHERETNVYQMNFDCESLTLCSAMSMLSPSLSWS